MEEHLTEEFLAGGFVASAIIFIIILLLIYYIVFSLSVMLIAQKTKTKYSWLAWIPFANIFLIANIAKQSFWYAVAIIILSFIPFVGGLVSTILFVFLFWKICERLQIHGAWSLLTILPFIQLILLLYLAFSSDAKEKKVVPKATSAKRASTSKKKKTSTKKKKK